MNRETFEDRKINVPDFVKKYVRSLDLDKIEFDDWDRQVRQTGHVNRNVAPLAESISVKGQEVPISVRKLGNGKYELKDGATRYLALQRMEETKILVSDYFDQVENKNDDDDKWYDYQCSQNDHPNATPNSKEDIQHQIQRRMNKGVFTKIVGHKYNKKPKAYIDKCVGYLKGVYPNSGHSSDTFKSMLKKSLKGAIAKSYHSHTVGTAMEFVKNHNKLGWSGKGNIRGVGEIDNGVAFYVPATKSNFVTNTCGNALAKKTFNKNVDVYVVYYVGDLAGKDDKASLKARAEVKKEFEARSIWCDDKGNKLFAGLYFLPQIKSGEYNENMYKLIKAV